MATTIGALDLNAFSDLYNDSAQYFWFESDSTATYGAGAHVTLVPDTSFISNPTGQNILMNTDGFSIRNGLLPMMTLDNDSLDFNIVDTTEGTFTTTATFTATGAQIGQSSAAHSVIDANGQRFYATDGTTQLANIGYGEGADAIGGTSVAPYYTFGIRNSTTVGNYSVAEGYNTTASAFAAHAEGYNTTASVSYSHAEGYKTKAISPHTHAEGNETIAGSESYQYPYHYGENAHAEGEGTIARGQTSHSEGGYTYAEGNFSHAEGLHTQALANMSHTQNIYTVADYMGQTVIGRYNKATVTGSGTTADPYQYTDIGDYAFIIGNGDGDMRSDRTEYRSNALTVDWNGGIQMYLDSDGTSSSAATSGDDMDLFNAIYNLGWYSDVIV